MMVWHVMQHVSNGHNTSYKTGRNWVESHDSDADAHRRASLMNQCRSQQCLGVEYVVIGPVNESIQEPFRSVASGESVVGSG